MTMKHGTLYDRLLAEEDLDEVDRAAKEKPAAKRRRLKALADLSLLKTPRKTLGIRTDLHEFPPDTQLAPRGGGNLCNTEDYLFLAVLLERSRNADYILQCGPAGKTQEWIYLPDNRQELIPEGFTVKQRRSPKEVRRLFKQSFFGFRKRLSQTGRSFCSYSIGGIEVRHAGSPGDQPFWDFAARLHHSFNSQNDPLLDDLHSRHFFAAPESRTAKITSFLCPIDGPVAAIEGKAKSPEWTWRMRCGREWHSALCPHCLGQLAEQLTRMN
jgi:hypothetical protein